MTMPRRALPLSVWAALGSATAGVLILASVGAGLAAGGRLDPTALVAGLGVGLGVTVLVSLVAAAVTDRAAGALRALHADAARRLADPSIPLRRGESGSGPGVRNTVELRELARILDALHLRVRVADGVAATHRRTAETASLGVAELLSGLVAAEEAARGQLAAELHDTVAQSLGQARQLLGSAAEGAADGGYSPEAATVERAQALLEEAEEQVRALMARTSPPALRDGDLASAVVNLTDDLRRRYGLSVELTWPARPHPLALSTAITVYRFFQEGLLNVVKHAAVEVAVLGLDVDDGVHAWVTDHGDGFDPAGIRPNRGRHVGLGLLRERARLAGGSLEVTSTLGAGSTLTLRLPVDHGRPRRRDNGTTPGMLGGNPAIEATRSA